VAARSSLDRRLYRLLLRAYPTPFRDRYGSRMLQAYDDRRRDAAARGRGALVRCWAGALGDLGRNAAAERRLARHRATGARPGRWSGLGHDLRQSVRQMWRQPGVTLAVLITLALGIGANATVFSAVHGLLGPLPFPAPHRLVQVWQAVPDRGIDRNNVTPAAALEWIARDDLFDAVGVYAYTTTNVTDVQPPERLPVARVSAGFFTALGFPTQVGRAIEAGDAVPGAPPVAVVSDGLWRRRFAGRADVVGRTIRLGDTPHTIVGVMPARFEHLSWRGADLWVPLALAADDYSSSYRVVARLRDGAGMPAVEQALDARALARSREAGGESWPPAVTVTSLHEGLVGDTAAAILFVQGAALLVLLIACANLANLLLARSTARRREFAIRASIGAGRARLVRQALVESTALGAAGGAAGLLVALWGVNLIVAYAPADMPRLDRIRLDPVVVAAGLALAGVTGLIVGLVPALRMARAGIDHDAVAGGRSVAAARQRPLRWLIVGEIALAVVVVGAGALLARALIDMQGVEVGLDTERVVAAEVSLPLSVYDSPEARRAMFDRMVNRVAALPGVEAAGVVDTLPLSQSWSRASYRVEPGEAAEPYAALTYRASRTYFETVGITLRQGRLFEASDGDGPPVLIVSASVAARHWPGASAVGRQVWLEGVPDPFRVVGVVGDVHHTALERQAEPGLYFSSSQVPLFRGVLVARVAGDPRALIQPMRTAIAELDPMLPLFNTRTIGDLRHEALAAPRLVTLLTGLFAALALTLGVVGVYGIVAFSVASRRRETAVRIALGARPADVARMFLRHGLVLSSLGLVLGLAGAAVAGTVLAGAAPEIPAPDAVTLGGVAAVMAVATMAACALPARRALRADPAELMRD